MSNFGTKKMDILHIDTLSGESVVTINGNVQLNGDLLVTTIDVPTIEPLLPNGTITINSQIQCNGNLTLSIVKTSTLNPTQVNGNITINGNVVQQSGSLHLTDGSSIKYGTSPPLTNYTTWYGPMVQGTSVFYDVPSTYALDSNEPRNGETQYYVDVTPLTISINKKFPTSKIKIIMSCSHEIQTDTVVVIRRHKLTAGMEVFEAELGVPVFDVGPRIYGTYPILYDVDNNTTMKILSFTFLDTGATSSGVYTYIFRMYHRSVSQTFYLNRTLDNAAGVGREVCSSTVRLEEYQ
jgi:archaellum component FlaF (FlaF/FlaG flagellin family)